MRYVIDDVHEGHRFEWVIELKPSHGPNPPQIDCPGSTGHPGRHWENTYGNEDSRTCWRCHGSGKINDPNFKWEPKPPAELIRNLRKVWKDYWNKVQNDRFTLT